MTFIFLLFVQVNQGENMIMFYIGFSLLHAVFSSLKWSWSLKMIFVSAEMGNIFRITMFYQGLMY